MLNINYSGKFKKDMKICQKRNYDIQLLKKVISILAIPDSLPEKNKDHKLSGTYVGHRECHILPDWLLVYKMEGNELYLARTGTHADLFDM